MSLRLPSPTSPSAAPPGPYTVRLRRAPRKAGAASKGLVRLIRPVPAFGLPATSSARLTLSLQMLAASPYGVLLASAMASAGVRKVIETSTGPKISTCAMVAAGETSGKSVGGAKQPPGGHDTPPRPLPAPPAHPQAPHAPD